MKKYVLSLLLTFISFVLCCFLLNIKKTNPSLMQVVVEIKILEDNNLEIFYSNSNKFDNNNKIRTFVKGRDKFQKVIFNLPEGTYNTIRFDIGTVYNESPIEIQKISFKTETGSISYDDIPSNFLANNFIEIKDNVYRTKVINGIYDPYFISKDKVSLDIVEIKKIIPYIPLRINLIISLIISLSVYVFIYQSKHDLSLVSSNKKVMIFTFFGILITPLLVNLFNINPKVSYQEKRELAKFPELTFSKNYPKDFEAYYNDNFGLRNILVETSSLMKIYLFKTSPSPGRAIFGKNKHLFSGRIDVLNPRKRTKNEVAEICNKIIKRKEKLNKKGIKHIVGFWPNKHSIYPELLPDHVYTHFKNVKPFSDQMLSYFRKKKFPCFDVRKDLIKEKDNYNLYQKLDGHWNEYGAYFAYKSFCDQTFEELNLVPYKIESFDIVKKEVFGGDLTNIMGVERIKGFSDSLPEFSLKNKEDDYGFLGEKGFPPRTVRTRNGNCGNKLKVLVFRDSYTIPLIKFLSLHFYEVTYIWQSYTYEIVNEINPDIIISAKLEGSIEYI